MSYPRSESAGPAAAASNRRRHALTYDGLLKELKTIVLDYARPTPFTKETREIVDRLPFTNESLRAVVKDYFEDSAATERRHGKIGTWDVGRVTDMSRLFAGHTYFDEDIGAWDTSSVTTMKQMFSGDYKQHSAIYAMKFNQDIGAWDTSSVTDMEGLFMGCYRFNADLGAWDTSSVTLMCKMFRQCLSYTGQSIGAWNVSSVTDMSEMFFKGPELYGLAPDLRRYSPMAFNADIGAWDTSSVITMRALFSGCVSFNADIGAWDTSSVKDLSAVLFGCSSFASDIGAWDVSSVIGMNVSFKNTQFNKDLSRWNLASLPDNMRYGGAFVNCPIDQAHKPPGFWR